MDPDVAQYLLHPSGVAGAGPRVPWHPKLTSRHPQDSSLNTRTLITKQYCSIGSKH